MRRIGIIGALAGMLGRLPAQIRENLQLARMGAVKLVSEAKGTASDPHAAKRAAKKLNRAQRRRAVSQAAHRRNLTPIAHRAASPGGFWRRPCKALRACGHNTHVRGH